MYVSYSRTDSKVYAQFTDQKDLLQDANLVGIGTSVDQIPDQEKIFLFKCFAQVLQNYPAPVIVYAEISKKYLCFFTTQDLKPDLAMVLRTITYRNIDFEWKNLKQGKPFPLDTRWIML